MKTRPLLLGLIMGLIAALAPQGQALAHRMNSAMSVIETSPTSGRLNITHSLFAHDLEGALGAGSVSMTWFETPQGQAALQAYCEERFDLQDHNGLAIPLSFVGLELRGDLINIYFEAPPLTGTSIQVAARFLHEVSDSQINQVNFRAQGTTLSAIFRAGGSSQRLQLPTR